MMNVIFLYYKNDNKKTVPDRRKRQKDIRSAQKILEESLLFFQVTKKKLNFVPQCY